MTGAAEPAALTWEQACELSRGIALGLGWTKWGMDWVDESGRLCWLLPWARDLTQALRLADAMRERGWYVALHERPDEQYEYGPGRWAAMFEHRGKDWSMTDYYRSDSPAECIARAALAALTSEQP